MPNGSKSTDTVFFSIKIQFIADDKFLEMIVSKNQKVVWLDPSRVGSS